MLLDSNLDKRRIHRMYLKNEYDHNMNVGYYESSEDSDDSLDLPEELDARQLGNVISYIPFNSRI